MTLTSNSQDLSSPLHYNFFLSFTQEWHLFVCKQKKRTLTACCLIMCTTKQTSNDSFQTTGVPLYPTSAHCTVRCCTMLQHPPERARPAVCCIDVSRPNNKESNSSIPAPHSSACRAGEKRKNLCCFCPFSGAILPPPICENPPWNRNGRSFYGSCSTWLEFPSGFSNGRKKPCVLWGGVGGGGGGT